jgi:hypothetical protein
MRRPAKVKNSSARVPLRAAALSASGAARGMFPAWIVADEGEVAFTARVAAPRVRDALVLRPVAGHRTNKVAGRKGNTNADGPR